MSIRVNVGLSRKQGLPDYGSLGASCAVDFEVDASLWDQDLARFQERVREAYVTCAQAVQEELARQRSACEPAHESLAGARERNGANGRAGGGPSGNGRRASRPATPPQIRAIQAIADRQGFNLGARLAELGVEEAAELNILQASQLIDELQQLAQQPE